MPKPHLSSLETEILAAILEIVDDESAHTTKESIVLVNKHFYATAQLVVHRRKSINYREINEPATKKQIQRWVEDPLMLRSIRQLTINGVAYMSPPERAAISPKGVAAMWAPVVELVRKTARLTIVNFDFGAAAFPLELLEALQTYHPCVKLCIWRYYRHYNLDHADAAELALARSPILRSIRTYIHLSGDSPGIDLRLPAFQRLIANAPNLRSASISQGQTDSIVPRKSAKDHAQEAEAAAKFFVQSHGPNTSIRSLTLDGFEMDKEMLGKLSRLVSLPHLERLKFSRGLPDISYFKAAPALLTNLKHVSLNLSGPNSCPELASLVDHYVASCAPLETLSLWSWRGTVSLDTILKHGPTLRTLQLHEREVLDPSTRRRLLSTEDLCRIRNECPQLHDFTLDMDREDADWQKDLYSQKHMLHEVTQFGRRLWKLEIYLDLGIAHEVVSVGSQAGRRAAQARAPSRDDAKENSGAPTEHTYKGPFPPCSRPGMRQHAEEVWKIVFGDPSNKGPRKLDIKWGEWERKLGRQNQMLCFTWEQRHRSLVVVRPEERDDKAGEARGHVHGGQKCGEEPSRREGLLLAL